MNFKKLVIFILLFVGLSYYYFHHELDVQFLEKNQELTSTKVLHLDKYSEVSFLQIERDESSVVLEKKGASWAVVQPVAYPADPFRMQSLINTLTVDKKIRDFGNEQFDFEKIGLAAPSVRIGIGINDLKRFLLLGDETYLGSNRYARWEDSDSVFVVSSNFWNVFQSNLVDLRDRRIFELNFNTLEKVSLSLPDFDIEFERVTEGGVSEWWVTHPVQNRLRKGEFTDYLTLISKVLITTYHDDVVVLGDDYGINDSEYSISFIYSDNEQKLLLGNVHDETSYYAQVEGNDLLLSVSKQTVDSFNIDCLDLIDKRIVAVNPFRSQVFVFEKGERKARFVKNNDRWTMDDDVSGVDAGIVTNIDATLKFLCSLEYATIIAPETSAIMAFEDDNEIFSVLLADDKTEVFLTFFVINDRYLIRLKDDPNVYEIQKTQYDSFNELLKSFL